MKTEICKSNIGNKRGWTFKVFNDGDSAPAIVAALYKTKRSATQARNKYIETGKIEFYGDAE